MKTVHFLLQGKGGVGKSLVASWLAQYLRKNIGKNKVSCFDTDPVNQTFSRYMALKPEIVNILDERKNINSRVFDGLIEKIIASSAEATVIDNGAATFVPLLNYMKENKIAELLEEYKIKVYFHVVVTGGQAMNDTLIGLTTILEDLNGLVQIWSNKFFGEVNFEGKQLENFSIINEFQDRIVGIIKMENYNPDTFGGDIQMMTKAHLTFDEVQNSELFSLMPRQRLLQVQRNIFDQLDQQTFSGNVLPQEK
ncbi:conjugal transfer protein TraL [Snodgrassella alvi]|uniref:nucleotide-binding protein n=1 Tax=Snodgrassella alvi TaxID=1196083 RepID=UPI00345FB0A2